MSRPSARFRPAARGVGGRVRVSKSAEPKRMDGDRTARDASIDGSTSSESSCSVASAKTVAAVTRRRRRSTVTKARVSEGKCKGTVEREGTVLKRRCSWITASSDLLYVAFHDEEWGFPVHDDKKLFEMFVLAMALAEINWPAILNNRDVFRKLFLDYDIASIANFTEKEIRALRSGNGNLLSDQRLRAVVENARQVLKINQQFGSFDNYCWNFVNNKPITNGYRFPHQVPIKSSKAEVISKDLIKRGFQCVGPTTIYSFMQAVGIVNDHLSCCFRHKDCGDPPTHENKASADIKSLSGAFTNGCSLQD